MSSFIVFIIILFILAALLRVDFFFTILYLFIGIFILSRFWSGHVLKSLRVKREMQPRAFLGDHIEVVLTLKNQSRLPIPWLMLYEVFPPTLAIPSFFRKVITMRGKSEYLLRYTLSAQKRGYYQVGPLSLSTGDLLSLRRELTSRLEPNALIVYPKIVTIARLSLPTHSPQVTLPTVMPLFQDPARPIGVRGYTPGDNPRHIHWTATASTGQMLVKQFEPAIARDNAIFLNLSRPDYVDRGHPETAIELAITVAASLANHMINIEDLPVGLVTTGMDPLAQTEQSFDIPPRKGRGHLMEILDVLARILPAGEEDDFLETVRRGIVRLSWGTTVIVITSTPSTELAQTLLLLKQAGLRVAVVFIDPKQMMHRQKREDPMPAVNVPVFRVQTEKDIEAWTPTV